MAFNKFVISAGHWNAENSGANCYINEVREARRVTKRVCEMLKDLKVSYVEIYDNVSKNQDANLSYIVKKHNEVVKNKADNSVLNVFIHFNASKKTDNPVGVEAYHYKTDTLGKQVSQKFVDEVAKVGIKKRSAKASEYYVLRKTYSPATLFEVCFVDSKADTDIYKAKFEEVCIAIVKALTGKTWKKPTSTPSPTPKPTYKVGEYQKDVVTTDNLNCRTGRGAEHSLIGTFAKGTKVNVWYIDKAKDGSLWGSCSMKGKTGFINMNYTKPV